MAKKSSSKKVPWRRSPEYLEVKNKALEPYHVGFYDDDKPMIKCFRCNSCDITPAHLLGVGAYPEMKLELLNILPMCTKHHFEYDHVLLGVEAKKKFIEEILPGRMVQLDKILHHE